MGIGCRWLWPARNIPEKEGVPAVFFPDRRIIQSKYVSWALPEASQFFAKVVLPTWRGLPGNHFPGGDFRIKDIGSNEPIHIDYLIYLYKLSQDFFTHI